VSVRKAVGEQTTLSWRKQRAGQRIIMGLPTPAVTPEFKRLVAEVRPAGFILFGHNVEEPAQVRELNRELAAMVPEATPAFLSVDQEGGRVRRIKATNWPPMRALGNMDDIRTTQQYAELLAEELLALGFNLNFAPCADVDSNPKNPVIGDRSFSRRWQVCGRHVAAFVLAHQHRGMIACAKHFPGHGDTAQDSHTDLPVVEKDPEDLWQLEMAPFRGAIAARVGMVMTSHVMYPTLDEDSPATLSRAILQDWLRGKMRYGGVIISDDMEMKAVRGRFPLDLQLRRSCAAGIDLFCVGLNLGKKLSFGHEVWETLVRIQEEDPAAHDDLAQKSVGRVNALRERFWLRPPERPPLSVVGSIAHRDLALGIRARGLG